MSNKLWTVYWDDGTHEPIPEWKEIHAPTDIEAAIKVGKQLEKSRSWRDGDMEFLVFEGPKPTPILLSISRSVNIKPKESS